MLQFLDGNGVEFPDPPVEVAVFLQVQGRGRGLAFKVGVINQHGGQVAQNLGQPVSRNLFAKQQHNINLKRIMFPSATLAENKNWQPGPYPGSNCSSCTRTKPPAGQRLRNFKPAPLFPPTPIRRPTNSPMSSGEWEESASLPPAHFFAPRGTQHGPHVARTEVISLRYLTGH